MRELNPKKTPAARRNWIRRVLQRRTREAHSLTQQREALSRLVDAVNREGYVDFVAKNTTSNGDLNPGAVFIPPLDKDVCLERQAKRWAKRLAGLRNVLKYQKDVQDVGP